MARVYGGYPYSLVQLGRETTPGTAVAATSIWRGLFGSPEDTRKRVTSEEQIGVLVPAERSYDVALGATLAMPATELTYEQVCHILEAGVGTVTPTGTGTYVRRYAFPTDGSVNTLKTYTIEAGNKLVSADVQEIPYCFVSEFELSGKAEEAWKMGATWMGQRLVGSSFTGSLALLEVSEAIFGNTKLYIDAGGGTIGTTQVLGVLMGATIRVKTGVVFVPAGDGVLYPTAHKFTKPEVTFSLTMELEQDTGVSRVATERGIFNSNGVRLIRLECPGLADREFIIDMAAKYDKIGSYENANGNTTVTIDGHAGFSTADDLFFEVEVTNLLATL